MRFWMVIALLAAAAAGQADEPTDIEPAVRTSTAATAPAASATQSATAAAARAAATPARHAPRPAAGAGAAPRPGVAAPSAKASGGGAHDQIDLDATQITGNRELPNVMYVVPWKKPDLGDFAGRPPKSLLDELLAPVDRDVFRRQNRYFAALHPDAVAAPEATTPAPAAGAAATLPVGDEK